MQNVFPRTLPPCAKLKRIHNVLERNALFETRPDETGFMFDCLSVRFPNVQSCSIGKILGWVRLNSIAEPNRSQSNDWSSFGSINNARRESKLVEFFATQETRTYLSRDCYACHSTLQQDLLDPLLWMLRTGTDKLLCLPCLQKSLTISLARLKGDQVTFILIHEKQEKIYNTNIPEPQAFAYVW